MILRNPTGRPIRLEILTGTDEEATAGSALAIMTLTIGAHASVDLARYQAALDALAWVHKEIGGSDDAGADQ